MSAESRQWCSGAQNQGWGEEGMGGGGGEAGS